MKKINFLLGVHCHQPVGNFEHVIEENYQKAYLPFIQVMSKYPMLKFSFHFSGILYDYFLEKHPEFIGQLEALVKNGQAEVLTGGYYEPVLSIIPDEDRLGQIELSNAFIKKNLRFSPRGLWLTERIWEPDIAATLAQAGIEYVTVDDYHFFSTGFSEEETFGYYVTEHNGRALNIFPISKKMRYLVPFKLPEETVQYLASVATEAGDRAVVLADDGEKFGGWPGTHKWVYEDGYLERILNLLKENAGWINTLTFSEYLDLFPPLGRVYLPTASYFEMMEWSLPTRAGKNFIQILKEIENSPQKDQYLSFLKGGFFRNFLVKYEEANNMHKKMLYVSQKLAAFTKRKTLFGKEGEKDERLKAALVELYKGQCNCAYWHGVFGGLYLDFLRRAVYEHLIAAENLLDQYTRGKNSFIELVHTDFDRDGREELLVSSNLLNLYLCPHRGATIFELDYRPRKLNLVNTLTRREETYHEKIKQKAQQETGGGVASIHERVVFKEGGLENLLSYDAYRRTCLVDHCLDAGVGLQQFFTATYQEQGDFIHQPYQVLPRKKEKEIELTAVREGQLQTPEGPLPLKIRKGITLCSGQSLVSIDYEVTNTAEKALSFAFVPEFNLSPLSGGEKDFYLILEGRKITQEEGLDLLEAEGVKRTSMVDERTSFSVSLEAASAYTLWFFKLFTVSQSEAGFEKNFQGLVVAPRWVLSLAPGAKWSTRLVLKLEE